jgi:hypothetical protein
MCIPHANTSPSLTFANETVVIRRHDDVTAPGRISFRKLALIRPVKHQITEDFFHLPDARVMLDERTLYLQPPTSVVIHRVDTAHACGLMTGLGCLCRHETDKLGCPHPTTKRHSFLAGSHTTCNYCDPL